MGRLIRSHDWRRTLLGPPEDWPQMLQILTRLMLVSSQPMFVVWGPERTTIYNDAYSEILAAKHPALGEPFDKIWHEIWERDLKPIVARAYAGKSLHMDDIPLVMMRKGYPEETHFSFSYTPVRDASGAVQGFFCPCLEITEQVLEQRRSRLRVELTEHLRTSKNSSLHPGHEAAALLGRHLRAEQAAYAEIVESGEYAVVARDWNDGGIPSNDGRHRLRDFGAAFVAELKAGRSIAIGDVREDPRTAKSEAQTTFASRGIRAILYIPHHRHGQLAAVLAVHASAPRQWHSADVALAEEMTERVSVAIERAHAEAARRESEERFRALVSSTSNMVYRMSPDWSEMLQLDGRGLILDTAGSRESWMDDYVPTADQPQLQAAIHHAIATKSTFDLEHRVRRADASVGWVHSRAVPLFGDDREIVEWFGAATDITDRKLAEQHQAILMAELDHRVKNVLSVVQSIARQSLRTENERGSDACDRFVGRLFALAQSHTLLANSRWQGAEFRQLVETAAAPYRRKGSGHVLAGGPDLQVSPKAAQTLTLVLHELVTNAAKYGALSSPDGHVVAEWELRGGENERRLVFFWSEHGGPPIDEQPSRKGFGCRLIEDTPAFELEGQVTLDFAREGLRAVFDLPFENLLVRGGQHDKVPKPAAGQSPARRAALEGKRILVVEDEYLVADEMAKALDAAGCAVAGPIQNLSEALRAAEAENLDAAVLDINLDGDLVWPAAKALRAQGIPFVFATGYSATVAPPAELSEVPRIEKPVQPQELLSVLSALIAAT